jgi:hypothetical protein
VRRVQPTDASERRRAEVVDYARRIVGTALGCEVRRISLPFRETLAIFPLFFSSSVTAPCFGPPDNTSRDSRACGH